MKALLDKYLIPRPQNEHKPHLLREAGVLGLAYVIVLLFFGSLVQSNVISTSPRFSAEVLPNVLVDLANQDRTDRQLAALTVNQTLVEAAKLKAQDMAANQYFAHTSPFDSTKTPWYWLGQAGYSFTAAGENLAIDFSDSGMVNTAWMNSPGHRANLLNAKFTEVGIAIAQGTYQGRNTVYVVQMFGKPKGIASSIPVAQAAPAETQTQPKPEPKSEPIPFQQPREPKPLAVAPQPENEASNQPYVAGTETKVIAEDTNFIAVEEVSTGKPELISDAPSAPQSEEASIEVPEYSTWYQRLLSSPRSTLSFSYMLISGLIILAILMMITHEVKRHHIRHILYGVLLLVLMAALLHTSKSVLLGEVLVK